MGHIIANFARQMVFGPQLAAFAPAMTLGAFWLWGEAALVALAVSLPALVALLPKSQTDAPEKLTPLQQATDHLDQVQSNCATSGRKSACVLLAVDRTQEMATRHSQASLDQVLGLVLVRLKAMLRSNDRIFRIADNRFAVILAPNTRCDLEAVIQLTGRLQANLEAPIRMDNTTIYASASIGFCLSDRGPAPTGTSLLEAAQTALEEARAQGGASVRAYTEDMKSRDLRRGLIEDEVETALENGEIRAWFQPQVSTDTGEVTGFEALARWQHREKGLLPPSDFLPVIERSGLMQRLAEVMLREALHALNTWDAVLGNISQVSLNVSQHELSDPKFADKIRWELDRFDVAPQRLCFEILETVVAAGTADVVVRNLSALAAMGCQIDLDDFGTGQTSITAIRRFSVGRLKIDRSFVARMDQDPEQQKMVSAILTMAERLGLETLAEGVETLGEHAMAAQLGCTHVQGYNLAMPMPLEKTENWAREYQSKLSQAPEIGRRAGSAK